MKQFEHEFRFFEIKKQKHYDAMHASLNEAGANGWEVVSFFPETHGISQGYSAFLKREVSTATVNEAGS